MRGKKLKIVCQIKKAFRTDRNLEIFKKLKRNKYTVFSKIVFFNKLKKESI